LKDTTVSTALHLIGVWCVDTGQGEGGSHYGWHVCAAQQQPIFTL